MKSEVDWKAYADCYDIMCRHNPAYGELLTRLRNFADDQAVRANRSLRILDLGSGTGNFSVAWNRIRPGDHLTLVEPSEPMAAIAREKLPPGDAITHLSHSAENLDFPTGHFDVLLCVHALYCLPDAPAFLPRLRSWLTPEGGYFLCDLGRPLNLPA